MQAATAAPLNRALQRPAGKPLLFAMCLLPLAWLSWGAAADRLGPNPAEALMRGSGDWTLRLLWATLAVTPLRQALGWPAFARYRRMLGLFTFFYAVLHFLAFAWLDMGLDTQAILRDIGKRPFILAGFSALVLLLPLAATSFDAAVRALGAARWRTLHRLVYAISLLAVLHFYWMRSTKNDTAEVFAYAAILVLLLGWRWLRRRR